MIALAETEGGFGHPVRSFQEERPGLLAIAARILGSTREAEDVLQEAYLRWQAVDHSAVRNSAAFLTRMVTRLAINVTRSAHRRRLELVGLVAPEGEIATATGRDPDFLEVQQIGEEVTRALALVLGRLTPVERAVFLLHECFGYSYAEIAGIVGKTEENCRQIERRARQRLAAPGEGKGPAGPSDARLRASFLRAARDGDLSEFVDLLAEDAKAYASTRHLSTQSPRRQALRDNGTREKGYDSGSALIRERPPVATNQFGASSVISAV